MQDTQDERGFDRRTVLKAGLTAAATATVGTRTAAATGGGSGATSADASLVDWLSDVGNFDGIVDERGASTVTVEVGAQGNGGGFGFGPAVVRVDPGTTVVWKWTGDGGSHNVVAKDGSFESKMQGSEGATFEQSFSETGVSPYYCAPHKPMGMKGAVVVGDLEVETPSPSASGGAGGDTSGDSDASSDGDASGDGDGESPGGGEVDYGGWFDDVSNFEGTYDYTGESRVKITVGAKGNNGNFAFGPAAVRVDPGTTVVWEWNGKGGSHDVTAKDGSYSSELLGSEGATFEQTFESEGVSKYACSPHQAMGMKGAVVVGGSGGLDPAAAGGDGAGAAGGSGDDLWLYGLAGGLATALLSPLMYSAMRSDRPGADSAGGATNAGGPSQTDTHLADERKH